MVSEIGCSSWSSSTSSSIRLWTWIAKSIPSPIRIGSPAIVTSERSIPISPSSEKLHSTPSSTASSGSSRQRTLKISHSTIAITTIAARPSLSIPPWR